MECSPFSTYPVSSHQHLHLWVPSSLQAQGTLLLQQLSAFPLFPCLPFLPLLLVSSLVISQFSGLFPSFLVLLETLLFTVDPATFVSGEFCPMLCVAGGLEAGDRDPAFLATFRLLLFHAHLVPLRLISIIFCPWPFNAVISWF